jgi:hypothetical protein
MVGSAAERRSFQDRATCVGRGFPPPTPEPARSSSANVARPPRTPRRPTRAQRRAKLRRILEAVERCNATRRDADRRAFLARLDRDIERADFQRYGWRSALCFSAIASFWEERQPELFADLETAREAPEPQERAPIHPQAVTGSTPSLAGEAGRPEPPPPARGHTPVRIGPIVSPGPRQRYGKRAGHGARRPDTGLVLRRHVADFLAAADNRALASMPASLPSGKGEPQDSPTVNPLRF